MGVPAESKDKPKCVEAKSSLRRRFRHRVPSGVILGDQHHRGPDHAQGAAPLAQQLLPEDVDASDLAAREDIRAINWVPLGVLDAVHVGQTLEILAPPRRPAFPNAIVRASVRTIDLGVPLRPFCSFRRSCDGAFCPR